MKLGLAVFFASIGVFFWMTYTLPTGFKDYPEETVTAAVFKCIPIATLLFIVQYTEARLTEHQNLKTNIFLGLFFSLIGDICLIWRHALFLPGASFFAVAHVFYIRGFKTSPLGLAPGTFCITNAIGSFIFFLPDLVTPDLVLVAGGYGLLVSCIWWRTIVHWQQMKTTASVFAMVGAGLFNLSDFTIMLDHAKFIAQVPYASVIIMVTYYLAQLGLAMSVAMYSPSTKKLR